MDENLRKGKGCDLGSLGKKMGSFVGDVGAPVIGFGEEAMNGLSFWRINYELRERRYKRWMRELILG